MRLRYEEHTWPELRELGKRDDLVVVIPTATLEDHGYHLPIDTDVRLVNAIAERAVEASGGKALLFPASVEALGDIGDGMSTEVWWSPAHPFKSSLTGETAGQVDGQ